MSMGAGHGQRQGTSGGEESFLAPDRPSVPPSPCPPVTPSLYGAALLALVLLGLVGCGSGPKAYPVKGKVVLADEDVQRLAGSYVEFLLENDPAVRASGRIRPDGSFTMQTLYEGKPYSGAFEGNYQARIVLPPSEENESGRPKRAAPVHKRFLDFKTSGLSYQVPTTSDVTVNVSRR